MKSPPPADQGESGRLFASLLACAEDSIATIDLEARIVMINEAGWQLFGAKSAAEMIGTSCFDVIPPEDREDARRELAAVSARESLRNREVEMLRRDGTRFPVEMTVTLLRGADAQPTGFLFIARDIRERRRQQEQTNLLLEIGRTLSSRMEQAEAIDYVQRRTAEVLGCDAVATFLWDPERRAFRVLGLHPAAGSAALGLAGIELGLDHPNVRRFADTTTVVFDAVQGAGTEPRSWLAPAGMTGVAWTQLIVHNRARGAVAAFTSQAGRVFAQNEIDMLEGVSRQLALFLEARHQYHAKETEAEVASALARAGHDLMLDLERQDLTDRMCELTTDLLDCDTAHTLMRTEDGEAYAVVGTHGYTPEQEEAFRFVRVPAAALSVTMAELEHSSTALIDLTDTARRDPSRRGAIEIGLRWSLSMPIRRAGEIVGFHFACRRAPERPFAERERQIAAGFARLTSIALQCHAALEALASASRLKSDFVAAISHELRTPLNIIVGYSSLMLDGAYGPLPSEQQQVLERIDRNAATVYELITGMLDLSRLEAGRVRLDLSEVDLGELCRTVVGETRELCAPGVAVTCETAVEPLQTDALKLKVVLKNLLTNALKFTSTGTVDVSARDEDGGVEIVVRDTGCGIPAPDQTAIFEAFRQAGGSARKPGGVGLGLYITKHMVEVLGGTIRVASEIDHGSTFTLWLPRTPPSHG